MTKLSNLLEKLRKRTDAKAVIEVAKDIYGDKSFTDEHLETYNMVQRYKAVPSVISVLSSSLVFVAILPNLHIFFSLVMGLIAGWLYEWLKLLVADKGLKMQFKTGSWAVLAFGLALYAGSMAFSVFGTYQGYLMLESETKTDVSTNTDEALSTLETKYDNLITEAKQTAQSYFDANTVPGIKGKPTIRDNSVKMYNTLTAKIGRLQDEKSAALLDIRGKHETVMSEAVGSLGAYLYVLIGVALIIEAVIFAFHWFIEYYKYRSFADGELLAEQDMFKLSLNSVRNMMNMAALHNYEDVPHTVMSQTQTGSGPNKIGFNIGTNGVAPSHITTAAAPIAPEQPSEVPQEATKPKGEKQCVKCGTTYKPSVSWQKYCTKECNHVANGFTLKK